MTTTKHDTTQGNIKPTDIPKTKRNGKTPAKPISLYPMSEEEALKRLLRVPPPEKKEKKRAPAQG